MFSTYTPDNRLFDAYCSIVRTPERLNHCTSRLWSIIDLRRPEYLFVESISCRCSLSPTRRWVMVILNPKYSSVWRRWLLVLSTDHNDHAVLSFCRHHPKYQCSWSRKTWTKLWENLKKGYQSAQWSIAMIDDNYAWSWAPILKDQGPYRPTQANSWTKTSHLSSTSQTTQRGIRGFLPALFARVSFSHSCRVSIIPPVAQHQDRRSSRVLFPLKSHYFYGVCCDTYSTLACSFDPHPWYDPQIRSWCLIMFRWTGLRLFTGYWLGWMTECEGRGPLLSSSFDPSRGKQSQA
jgi:hypothetical protein